MPIGRTLRHHGRRPPPVSAAQGLVATALVPLNGRVVALGDSISAGALIVNGITTTYAAAGWLRWMLHGLNNSVRIPAGGMLAVTGYSLGQISDSMGAGASNANLTALSPDLVTFMGGTNNLGSFSAAQLITAVDPILTKIMASATKLVLIVGAPPQKAGALTTQQNQNRIDYNTYLASFAAANAARVSYLNPDTLGLVDADFTDNVHPNDSGAKKIGVAAASLISSRVTIGNIVSITPAIIRTQNPTFTGGTTIGTNWSVSTGNAGGATVTMSKEAGTGAQLCTINGSYSGTQRSVLISCESPASVVGMMVVGQEYEAVTDIDLLNDPVQLSMIDISGGSYNYGKTPADIFKVRSDLESTAANRMVGTGARKFIGRSATAKHPAGWTPQSGDNITTELRIMLIDAVSPTVPDIQLRINVGRFQGAA